MNSGTMLGSGMHKWKKRLRNVTVGLTFFLFSASSTLAQVNTAFDVPLSDKSPVDIVLSILSWILGIMALVAVVIIVYAGIIWMTSQGVPEKVSRAKAIIINALVGLLIILSAWGIVLYFLGVFNDILGNNNGSNSDGSNCTGCSVPSTGSSFYVLSTYPEAGDTDVYLCTDISVRMSDFIDQSSVNADNFFVRIKGGSPEGADCSTNNACESGVCQNNQCVGDHVAGEIGFGPGDETKYMNFIPSSDLEVDAVYEGFVVGGSSGVLSTDSNPEDSIDDRLSMSTDYQWFFTTGSSTDNLPPTVKTESVFPADGENNVCTNTVINMDFSEPMRITSFNDDVSFLLDSAGTEENPSAPDWADPRALKNWTFGGDFDYVQAKPEVPLDTFAQYAVRAFGGDAANNFAGAVTDSCGNALDGDADGSAEGSTVDNYIGFDAATGATEDPITWVTGENASCDPVIENVTQSNGFYGEDGKLRDGEACSEGNQCGSGVCSGAGICQGYPETTIEITGLYLAPHPEIRFEGSVNWASSDFNTCFDEDHYGNIPTNTTYGDACVDDPLQKQDKLVLRTPVGSGDTSVQVGVANDFSEFSNQIVDVQSPHIVSIDPDNGAVGQYITISGENFGATQGSVILTSADKTKYSIVDTPEACGNVWSDNEILVVVPETYISLIDGTEGKWQTGEIAYFQVSNTSNGRASDLQLFTFSDTLRPNLCDIIPSCQDQGGAAFTLTGDHFGDSQGSSEVAFAIDSNRGYNASINNWADIKIEGTTDTAMTQDEYWVTVYDGDTGLNSNGRTFTMPCNAGPKVVEINSCNPEAGEYPYPNPQPGDQNACINATVGVMFDQKLDPATLNTSTFSLQQYNNGNTFDSGYNPLPVQGSILKQGAVQSGANTYYVVRYNINSTPYDGDQNGIADGGTSIYLQPNTWYQLTISTGVQNDIGVSLSSPYVLRFKTKDSTDLCQVDQVSVAPSTDTHGTYWKNGDVSHTDYTADAYTNNCEMLDSSLYTWDWAIDKTNIGNFGSAESTGAQETVYVSGQTVENEGTATVTAAVEGVDDDATFKVDLGFCTSDDDCTATCGGSSCNLETNHCTPVINSITPGDGDHGTWVTVNGCMFGGTKGNAYWNTTNDSISAQTAWPNADICGTTWTETQVIVEVPEQYDTNGDDGLDAALPEGAYNIKLETFYGDSTESPQTFTVNQTERPGLCQISPAKGTAGDSVTAYGRALGTEEGFASFLTGSDAVEPAGPDRLSADESDTDWSAERINTEVPVGVDTNAQTQGANGFVAITAGGNEQCTDGNCSNPVNFIASCSANGDCASGCCSDSGVCASAESCNICVTDADCVNGGQCGGSTCDGGSCTPVINSLIQNEGPVGAAVTINGCYFGSYAADESHVVFGGVEAELMCNYYWTNTTIIAQVPEGLPTGASAAVNVSITTRTDRSTLPTEKSQFLVTAQCPDGGAIPAGGLPVLCALSPSSGYSETTDHKTGQTITFKGDNFVETGQSDVFYENSNGKNVKYVSEQKSTAQVPENAKTGPASVEIASTGGFCESNGLNFAVACSTAADCAEGQNCINGLCSDSVCGGCTVGNDASAEASCGSGQGCYMNDDQQACCAAKPLLQNVSIDDGEDNVCPNSLFTLTFSEAMGGFQTGITIEAVEYNSDGTVKTATAVPAQIATEDKKVITIQPSQTLNTTATYRLHIKSDPADGKSVYSEATQLTLLGGTHDIEFTTAASTCKPTHIELQNTETEEGFYTFTAPDSKTTFTATMYASNNQPLAPTSEMGWEFTWSPYFDENSCANVAWVELTAEEDQSGIPSATTETQAVVSGSENDADTSLVVRATPTTGSQWEAGTVQDGIAALSTYFCKEDELWEYVDADATDALRQNIRLIYCDTADVPTLGDPTIIAGAANDDFFRQYLFTDPANGKEAFGIRVYENELNLTPSQWYAANVPQPGSPSGLQIDGYQAIRDGNSYYIAASNIIDTQLYNNIYLFTFNESSGIQQISEDIIKSVRFNWGMNYQNCEASDKEKLVRDTKRVNDLGTIAYLANQYYQKNGHYPRPKSESFSSYIDSLTNSVWLSWQGALGNELGQTLPTDPYNFFYASENDEPWTADEDPWTVMGEDPDTIPDCRYDPASNIFYDEAGTCWDPINKDFFCPANSHTYLWKIDPARVDNADDAYLYAHLEYQSDTTETYENLSTLRTSPCDNVPGADCSCYNYGITSETAPGTLPWEIIP